MAEKVKHRIAFEVGHVLFIDVVGYSKMLIIHQIRASEDILSAQVIEL